MAISRRRTAETNVVRVAREIVEAARKTPESWLPVGVPLKWLQQLTSAVSALEAIKPTPIDDSPGPAVRDAPDTSREAAARSGKLLGKLRREVLELIRHSPYGHTCEEVERNLEKPHTSVSSAVNSLRDGGWIEDSGMRRTNRSGRQAIVWYPVMGPNDG